MGVHYCKFCGEYCSGGAYIIDKDSNDLCVGCAQVEWEKMEDQLRWRKFPDEKPEKYTWVIVDYGCESAPAWRIDMLESNGWASNNRLPVKFWRPTGEIPKVEVKHG